MLDFLRTSYTNNNTKTLKDIVIDSLIVAAIVFVASLPSEHMPNAFDIYTAIKAFLYTFVIQIAAEKGIKPYIAKRSRNNDEVEKT
jgi:hypothetical protein